MEEERMSPSQFHDAARIRRGPAGKDANRRFLEAKTPKDVGLAFLAEARKRIGITGFNFLPVCSDNVLTDATADIVSWNEPTRFDYRRFLRFLPVGRKELMSLPELLAGPKVCDLYAHYGSSHLESTVIFNELWRKTKQERQIVAGMGTLHEQFGYVSVARPRSHPPFKDRDVEIMRELTTVAERSLRRTRRLQNTNHDPKDVLSALDAGLPDPAILFDATGRVLWANREARLWMDLETIKIGRCVAICTASAKVETMKQLAKSVAREPSRCPTKADLDELKLLDKREKLVVKRFREDGAMRPKVLLCISRMCSPAPRALTPAELSGRGLTSREAEVAALATRGRSVAAMAESLNIAESTVHTHLKRIYKKLGVRCRAELAHTLLTGSPSWTTAG
jgi:DNA-binding CsgD family transcriptional regulator